MGSAAGMSGVVGAGIARGVGVAVQTVIRQLLCVAGPPEIPPEIQIRVSCLELKLLVRQRRMAT